MVRAGTRQGIAFLAFQSETLFIPNQILLRFVKKYINFHQKFAKIEDFKVGYSEKTTKFIYNPQNP